jgi:hypothetical protein
MTNSDEGISVKTSNPFYRLGSEIILAALVSYPEVLPTLVMCAIIAPPLIEVNPPLV